MSQLSEILEIEKKRDTAESQCVVNLFQEGTFYRAYEWSAWLCFRYIRQFKPTHRLIKDSEDSIVFVGFPVTSLQKYTPQDAEVSFNGDKSVIIRLPQSLLEESGGAETMAEEFANWKRSVPLTESSKKKLEEQRLYPDGAPMKLTDIVHGILSYPVEQRTPMECMMFLAELKQQVSKLI
ncbi:MAG: hypothetical protein MJZ81_12130 [Bacteroidales bacterium]|nr:hypothetical protein [Bacteroidales bacterium]